MEAGSITKISGPSFSEVSTVTTGTKASFDRIADIYQHACFEFFQSSVYCFQWVVLCLILHNESFL